MHCLLTCAASTVALFSLPLVLCRGWSPGSRPSTGCVRVQGMGMLAGVGACTGSLIPTMRLHIPPEHSAPALIECSATSNTASRPPPATVRQHQTAAPSSAPPAPRQWSSRPMHACPRARSVPAWQIALPSAAVPRWCRTHLASASAGECGDASGCLDAGAHPAGRRDGRHSRMPPLLSPSCLPPCLRACPGAHLMTPTWALPTPAPGAATRPLCLARSICVAPAPPTAPRARPTLRARAAAAARPLSRTR